MRYFDNLFFENLIFSAKKNRRKRQHSNIHNDYLDSCQKLFNAIEPESYIRPHRHLRDPRDELLVAIHGSMAFILFDDVGLIKEIKKFSSRADNNDCKVIEVNASEWHTIVSLEEGSILLEVKSGPFNPDLPKDLASWAPLEGSEEARIYLKKLNSFIS